MSMLKSLKKVYYENLVIAAYITRLYRSVLDYLGLYKTIKDYIRLFRTMQDYIGLHRTL